MSSILLYCKLLFYKLLVYILPSNPSFMGNLAVVESKLKLYSDALWSYSLAICLDPDPDLFFNRGITYTHMGELNLAIEQFSEAILLKSDFIEAYYNRASIYQDKKMFDCAIDDYTEILTKNPSDLTALFNRSLCYTSLGNYSSSITDLNSILNAYPFKDAYSLRGTCYYALDNLNQAVSDYFSAQRLDSVCFDCESREEILGYYEQRVDSINKTKNLLSVIRELTSLLCKNPKDSKLYLTRGVLNSQFPQRLEEALQDLNTCLSYNSYDANAYYERAKLKAYLNDVVGCKKDMLQASNLNSSFLPYTCMWLLSHK